MTQSFLMGAPACGRLTGLSAVLDGLGILPSGLKMDGEFSRDLPCALAVRQGFAFADPSVHADLLGLGHAFREHGLVQRVLKAVAFTQRVIRPLFVAARVDELPLT